MRFYYFGEFDSNGVSQYINQGSTGSIFDPTASSYLNQVNTFLPERKKLHHEHPEWLSDNCLDFIDNTEVSITFVDEGAGYRNAIGYYIYPSDNPPNTIANIQECYFIFPNCSKAGSGGNLHIGDTIRLPFAFTKNDKYINPTNYVFPAGYSIGFILYPNGWNGDGVSQYIVPFTSCSSHNPETAPELKYHTACIVIPNTERLLFSFEDINRESTSCDHDFNDAIFFINTTISSVGKGFISTKDFAPNDDEPGIPDEYTIGYKKIFSKVDNKVVECVATLYIPTDSTITKKRFYVSRCKTNRAYVKSIIVVPAKTSRAVNQYISRKLTTGYSWYNSDFPYQVGSYVTAELTADTDSGIYFYHTFKEASDYDFSPTRI